MSADPKSVLDRGRQLAHEQRRRERELQNERMQNFWQLCKRSGYHVDEFLQVYALRYGVQRETARRRARKLGIL